MSETPKTPWKDGIYANDQNIASFVRVTGEKVEMFPPAFLDFPDMEPMGSGTWTFGDFEPAHEDVQKVSGGIKNNNVDMNLWFGKILIIFPHFFLLKKKSVTLSDNLKCSVNPKCNQRSVPQ